MMRKISLTKRSALLGLLVFGVLLGAASAQTESVLYSFCAHSNCTDGVSPAAGLAFDQNGNQYGTTFFGGAGEVGVVFKLTPKGKETVLYSFCPHFDNCPDGQLPQAGLVFDQKGNLYGTTSAGGTHCGGCGTVFKLTPKGEETVLHSFGVGSDGFDPRAGLVFDQKGNLYGTTFSGGAHGDGIVFKLTPNGKETVLYSFCGRTNCTDGGYSAAGLVFDQKGNLYGTTTGGGAHGEGVVFKLTPTGKETVLYSFCRKTNCTDGASPIAGLIFDQKGNLYGTTVRGGLHNVECTNTSDKTCGVVFKLTPKGEEIVLHSFCAQTNCTDGDGPSAGLVFDQKGNLYGTAFSGGVSNPDNCSGSNFTCGVVFKLTPKGKETVLHSFCGKTNCTDGQGPMAGLIFDQKGNLYGTTYDGGAHEEGRAGVVFKLTP